MPKTWFVHISGENVGPLTTKLIVGMLQGNRLQFVDYIWCDGLENWTRISEVEDFAEHMPPFPSVEFPQPEPEPEPEPEPVEEEEPEAAVEEAEVEAADESVEEEPVEEVFAEEEAAEEAAAVEEEAEPEPEPEPEPAPPPRKPAPALRAVPGGKPPAKVSSKAPVPAAKATPAKPAVIARPAARPAAATAAAVKPVAKASPAVAAKASPAARPVAKPAVVAAAKPAGKPAPKPVAAKPAPKPAAKPAPKAPAKRQWRVPIDARVSIDGYGDFAVLDISEGGLMVEATVEIAVGSDLRLNIESPSLPKSLDMTALLVRQETFEGKRSYGIEFTKVNPAHRRVLAGYVKSKLSIEE